MALLEYDFSAVGMANIDKALTSLERRFAQHNQRVNAMLGTRSTGGGAAARAGGPSAASAANAATRASMAQIRTTERERIASEKRVERARIASERTIGREQEKQAKYWAAARQKAAETRRHEQQQFAASRADFVKSTVGKGFGRVMNGARAVGTAGLALTGIGGAALAGASISQALTLDEKSRRLAISGRGAGEADMYSPKTLQRRATQTGIETGMRPEDILDASQAFVGKTGDIKSAIENQKVFATVAQATGASLSDVALTAADLSQKFDIKGAKEMGDALAVLAFQGKKGAFELKDMAETFPELSAAAQRIGMKGVGGMKTLGGLAQIARQSTGSGAEASTALQMALTQLTTKSGQLHSGAALGGRTVDVFEGGDPTKKARDVPTVLAEIISRSHGNQEELAKLFDVRGIRAMSPLVTQYQKASDETKGTSAQKEAAGKNAVLAYINDAANASGSFADVQKDANDAAKSTNIQFEILSTQLKGVVAAELFPYLVELAKELPRVIGPVRSVTHAIVAIAEALLDHPLYGLGMILAAAIGAEVLKARLGEVFTSALEKMTGVSTNGGTAAAPGKVGGMLGAAGMGAAIGITLATAIFTAGVVNFENAEVNMKTAGDKLNQVREAGLGDVDMVRKQVQEQTKRVVELENPSLGGQAANLISFGATTDQVQIKTQQSFLDEMVNKLHALESLNGLAEKLTAAGVSQQDAAKQLQEAATKLGVKMPNTGNAPSPVKS